MTTGQTLENVATAQPLRSGGLVGGRSVIACVRVTDDGLLPYRCPLCNGPLKDDWHGVAACFCNFGGKPPRI